MMDPTTPDFVEAAIYMASDGDNAGQYAGQYVATCAKDECGYFGESVYPTPSDLRLTRKHKVPLERFYDKQSPVRSYARRGKSG
jgi:hypothetical protein